MAKQSAVSWEKTDLVEKYTELDKTRKEVYDRIYTEQWAMNETIHFNEWENFTPEDYTPVVEAFQDLFDLFLCGSCGRMISLAKSDNKITNVRCPCETINWNIVKKTHP